MKARVEMAEVNGFRIALPIGLPEVLKTAVPHDSYQTFLRNDWSLVKRHLMSLTTLLPKYVRSGDKCLHCFGGVGATAQVIDQALEGDCAHAFWERDPVLVDFLREKYELVKHVEDSYAEFLNIPSVYLDQFDVILFDPSVGSIKTILMKEVWERLARIRPRVVWVSDTACSKIHLNARFYEADFGFPVEPTAEGYLNAYTNWLRTRHDAGFVAAMREAQETYGVVQFGDFPFPVWSKSNPIPYV